jgi:mannose-6-phosphate isomerase-like protein (cupin superfamily)
MKIIRGGLINAVPASHEKQNDPGCVKKVLAKRDNLADGKVQMINWSTLLPNKNFEPHYHEDMQEIFIILNGEVEIEVDKKRDILRTGDAVIINEKEIHKMFNKSKQEVHYIAIGISREMGGKTVNV